MCPVLRFPVLHMKRNLTKIVVEKDRALRRKAILFKLDMDSLLVFHDMELLTDTVVGDYLGLVPSGR